MDDRPILEFAPVKTVKLQTMQGMRNMLLPFNQAQFQVGVCQSVDNIPRNNRETQNNSFEMIVLHLVIPNYSRKLELLGLEVD
jgi:hypothetical protein